MSPERWQQVEQLYHAALAQKPGARAAFLASACAGDESLRREVASLLAEGERIGGFMELQVGGADAPQPSLIGQTVGHYRIISMLGKGGMGEVYLGEDTTLRRKVALKLLPAALTADRERLRRFKQEARNASALNHPNIITIYEFGQTGAAHYLVTEYIEGETLASKCGARLAALSLD